MSCNVCFAPAVRQCSKCHKISYCSHEHERTDWSIHKSDCAKESIAMSSGCSSNSNLNPSEFLNDSESTPPQLTPPQLSPQQESSTSQAAYLERLDPEEDSEEDSENTTPIDENFDYTNHSHNQFKNLTGNTMSIGEVNMINPTGGPNLNFK